MPGYYDIGDAVEIRTSTPFQDADTGTAVDPATVQFVIKEPDGTRTTYTYGTDPEVTKEGTGDYSMIVRPDAGGVWRYAVEGFDAGGNALGAEESRFEVAYNRARV